MLPRLLLLNALLVAFPAGAVTMDWVYVGNPGNAPDTASQCGGFGDCGSVAHAYYIAKYEVTNAQYAEFLNAVDPNGSNTLALYSAGMGADATFGGILLNSGHPAGAKYSVKVGFANKPVTFVSMYDALRFSNWLNNGQGAASTETGAYTLLGNTPTPSNGATVARNTLATLGGPATTFLPSLNEWYKAAYFSPGGTYFDYPTGTNTATSCAAPGTDTGNSANCHPYAHPPGSLTNVGAYALSDSPYGTFDQGGNVFEWNESLAGFDSYRGIRGGSWFHGSEKLAADFPDYSHPTTEDTDMGFRVATVVPISACDDELDNDGDGSADLADPGCDGSSDVDEHSPTLPCDDGADNDGDTKADYLASGAGDPGCFNALSLRENPKCQDGLDNDGEAGIDFDGGASLDIDPLDGDIDEQFNGATPAVGAADPQCVGRPWGNRERSGCGLGFEIVLLAPLLVRWARMRRA